MARTYQVIPALSGVVTSNHTTTSNGIDVSVSSATVVAFTATAISSGNGVFTINGSVDGANYNNNIYFQDANSANATTFINSKTVSSNGTFIAIVPIGYKFIKVQVVPTTDGTYSSAVGVQEN